MDLLPWMKGGGKLFTGVLSWFPMAGYTVTLGPRCLELRESGLAGVVYISDSLTFQGYDIHYSRPTFDIHTCKGSCGTSNPWLTHVTQLRSKTGQT